MIKACIFDFDGTVADTLTSISYYCNRSLKKFGLPEIDKERYKHLIGNGADVLIRRMIDEVGADQTLYEDLRDDYLVSYKENPSYLVSAYDGISEMLKIMKEKGIKLAVLSNKPHKLTVSLCDLIFGEDTFDIVFGGRDGVPLKPDITALNEILNSLDVLPADCLYFGDTSVDMKTGKSAGIKTVAVLWGFRDKKELIDSGADVVVSHANEIIKLIQ